LREAFRLWRIPLDAALLICGMAAAKISLDPSLSFASTAPSTFLIAVFTLVLADVLRNCRFSLCFALLIADLCEAKNLSPSSVCETK